jgi:hypothetical protein
MIFRKIFSYLTWSQIWFNLPMDHRHLGYIAAAKGGRGWMRTCKAPANLRAPTDAAQSDGETMRPCQIRSVHITCTPPPDSRRPVWLVGLFVCLVKSRFKENCEDSAAALSQGWSRNFYFCQGSFSYHLQQESRVYFSARFLS